MSTHLKRMPVAAALLAVVLLLAFAASAMAQTYTVSNLSDTGVANDGSLRGEIKAANTNPGVDTIDFAAGLSGTIKLSGTELTLSDGVDIAGPGADQLTVEQVTAGHRVVKVDLATPGPVTISGLHLTGGSAEIGGDIDDTGGSESLTFVDCLITDGTAETDGGGIFTYSPLTLLRTTVSGNHSDFVSGGAVADEFKVIDSVISGNTANNGDAGFAGEPSGPETGLIENSLIANNSPNALYLNDQGTGQIVVRNSTITGNKGAANLYTGQTATITFVGTTIADNVRPGGAGIYIEEGGSWTAGTTFEDSIIWGNASSPVGSYPEIKGPVKAAFSLIGEPKGVALTETIPGSDLLRVDPQLRPLEANGGATQTMAVETTSPVVNKGAAFGLTTDGRGDARPSIYPGVPLATAPGADGSDIGAYELQAPVVPPPASPAPVSPPPPASPKVVPRSPKVRLHCAKSAGSAGCRFKLQVVSAKPKRVRGKVRKPTPESAVAKLKLGAGKSGLLTLRPKAAFAVRLDAAKTILVRETVTLKGKSATSYRRLKIAG
jgi:hypothetical protein